MISVFFFFNDTAATEIYTLSLHDALPISGTRGMSVVSVRPETVAALSIVTVTSASVSVTTVKAVDTLWARSEEHTSELQSRQYLVCRLLLEKKQTVLRSRRRSSLALVSLL